jgi:hypothetical protein
MADLPWKPVVYLTVHLDSKAGATIADDMARNFRVEPPV